MSWRRVSPSVVQAGKGPRERKIKHTRANRAFTTRNVMCACASIHDGLQIGAGLPRLEPKDRQTKHPVQPSCTRTQRKLRIVHPCRRPSFAAIGSNGRERETGQKRGPDASPRSCITEPGREVRGDRTQIKEGGESRCTRHVHRHVVEKHHSRQQQCRHARETEASSASWSWSAV